MTTGPQTEMTAGMAAHGRLRASYTDREQMIDVLKAAFVQGRLTKDEFDARIGQALSARTYAELAAFLTDNAAVFMVAIVVTVSVFLASPAADALMLGSGHKKHSGGQLPPPPAPTPNFMRGPA